MTIIQFGKYKGSHISTIPDDYIQYLIEQKKKDLQLYLDEQDRRARANEASMSMADRIIDAGYKAMALKLHPDKGGDGKSMTELNATYEQIKAARQGHKKP